MDSDKQPAIKNEEQQLYDDFLNYFDGKVPNPNQYPKKFEFYIKMYLNSKNINKEK